MSILETHQTKEPHEESWRLRLELKEWEKAFAAAHGGRKAGREDIKEHPEIGIISSQICELDDPC